MANTFKLVSAPYDGRYMQLECTQTQNINSNTSTIAWKLSTIGGNSNFYSTGATTVTINGTQVYYKARTSYATQAFPAAKGSESGTLTVAHNANGAKSIAVSFSTVIYDAENYIKTYSGTWDLDSNPRAAALLTATDFTNETNPTITYNNYVGNNASTLEAYIYANDATTMLVGGKALSKTGTSYTYSLTTAEINTLLTASKSAKSIQVKFYIKTVISGTTYWSSPQTKTFSVVNANPSASITYYDSNADATALTGDNQTFIKGVSNLTYTIAATAQKQATISAYKVTCGSAYATGASNTIAGVSEDTFTYRVTDTRGNYYEDSIGIDFINYIPLSCKQEVAIALEGETEAKVTLNVSGNYYNGGFGAEDNYIEVYYRYSVNGGAFGDWIVIDGITFTSGGYSASHIVEGLNYENSYTFQCCATDAVGAAYSATYTAKLNPIFDWGKDGFNFNVPVSINGAELDYIVEQGTKNGWSYRKWSSGVAECWKILTHTTALSATWGALYCGNTLMARQSYPFTFAEKPVEIVNLLCTGNAGWLTPESGGNGMNGEYASAIYNVVRPNSVTTTQTFNFAFYVKGRYK